MTLFSVKWLSVVMQIVVVVCLFALLVRIYNLEILVERLEFACPPSHNPNFPLKGTALETHALHGNSGKSSSIHTYETHDTQTRNSDFNLTTTHAEHHAFPHVYVITPTYTRLSQKADLTRMSHALIIASHRVPIHWIIVEDEEHTTEIVANLLARTGVAFTHLNKKGQANTNLKGGEARNEGIRFLRSLRPPPHLDSVVYFGGEFVTRLLPFEKNSGRMRAYVFYYLYVCFPNKSLLE